jgi:hypothetical protein
LFAYGEPDLGKRSKSTGGRLRRALCINRHKVLLPSFHVRVSIIRGCRWVVCLGGERGGDRRQAGYKP